MSIIDRTKSSIRKTYRRVSDKWSGFKDFTNSKTLRFGDWLNKNYNWIKEDAENLYQRLNHRYKVRKYQGRQKLQRKWQNSWSAYANYFIWTFTPYVIVYGIAVNFVLSQIGLFPLSIGNIAASGIGTYFVKEEFPEWMNGIEWLHKDSRSEV